MRLAVGIGIIYRYWFFAGGWGHTDTGGEMENIGSWVRQARHRAKKYGVISSLTISEAGAVLNFYDNSCAYCGGPAGTLDHPMPLAEGGPNVQANVLTCCRRCKFIKRNRSVVWMYGEGMLPEQLYLQRIREMLCRAGAEHVRAVMRRDIGLIQE